MSSLLCASLFSGVANAAWIWTPETKKFTNPKNAVKDTPKEQFEWAMTFYNAKDFQRAAFEFDKLAKQYEFSDYASKSQYYVGLCYENMQKYYMAYENYQKAIDNFPHLSNTDEVLAREYAIGLLYLEKPSPKVMGTDIMAPLDRAVEIFKKVVENAPYGKYAEDAQFKLGEALKKSERYEEAIQAYHKITEDYPNSRYATQAMYEESYCAYRASLKPAYDATATDNAIKTFEKFADKNKDAELAQKADTTMKRLKDNVAQKSFDVAKFYESQGKTEAAIIYYQDVIDSYPESSYVKEAKAKIEAIKNKSVKKAAAPPDLSKKKSKDLTAQPEKKLSWNLFGFGGKKEPKAEQPQEAPKKKGWRPFSFETKKEVPTPQPITESPKVEATPEPVQAPQAVEQTQEAPKSEQVQETPKAEDQVALEQAPKIEAQTEPVQAPKTEQPQEETPKIEQPQEAPRTEDQAQVSQAQPAAPIAQAPAVQQQEAPKKKGWTPLKPFSFFGEKKTKEPAAQAQEAPKKKSWTPLKFDDKKEKKVEAVEKKPVEKKPWKPLAFFGEKKAEEPATQAQEAPKKKGWAPFNFEETKKEKTEGAAKKQWKPLYFGTNDETMTKGMR